MQTAELGTDKAATGKTLVVLAGPTASGKTDLGIYLARQLGTQILSVDSRQCYRELSIGVARPSGEELAAVPHHFIASHSIHDEVNAGIFAQYGLGILNKLFEQHDVVLAVGGTGLYIKALTSGIDAMPRVEDEIRQQILQQYQLKGLSWLQGAVQKEDPLFWASAEQMNPQRLMRGLEFMRGTGRSIIEFRTHEKQKRDFQVLSIALDLPREVLYDRINRRVIAMTDQGLQEEVKRLYPLRHLNALQTVGYREWYPYFEGHISLEKVIETIQKNTRHYAKRQLTWFRKQEDFQWFSPLDREKILNCIQMRTKS